MENNDNLISEKGFYWCYHTWRYCDNNCDNCSKITEEQKKVKDEFNTTAD